MRTPRHLPKGNNAVRELRNIRDTFILEKGYTSFCDGHGTRYWRFSLKGLKRSIPHYIETFDHDFAGCDKYHCYIDYGGCIGDRSYSTDSFKDAVKWISKYLKNYFKQREAIETQYD